MELPLRHLHTYILGTTGSGKSTLQKSIILSDIAAGDGVFFIDPHGFDTDDLIGRVPKNRIRDIILFDPSDHHFPIAWNPLGGVPKDEIPFVASSIVDTIKDAWDYGPVSTPTLDQYLYNGTYALLEARQPLLGLKFMLTSQKYRQTVLKAVSDPIILDFWQNDFPAMSEKDRRDTTRSTLNKIGALLSDARIRNVLGQAEGAFSFPEVIQDRRIFLARLPQGRLGIQKTKLIGSLLLTQFHLAALARDTDHMVHVHLDELHTFAGQNLELMLSGIRKFNVSLTLVHQYLDQLAPTLKSAILGNVGTKVIFRVSRQDARELIDVMGTNNLLSKLYDLAPHEARIITADAVEEVGVGVELPPYDEDIARRVLAHTRRHYARDRKEVEGYIRRYIEKT